MTNPAGSLAFAEIVGKRDEKFAMWTVRPACRDEKFWNAHAKNHCWSNRTQPLRTVQVQDGWLIVLVDHKEEFSMGFRHDWTFDWFITIIIIIIVHMVISIPVGGWKLPYEHRKYYVSPTGPSWLPRPYEQDLSLSHFKSDLCMMTFTVSDR